jgi:hypothetical protein
VSTRERWRDPYDGAKHPDTPEPADRPDPEPPHEGYDPADDADLGTREWREGLGRRHGKGHWER